MPVATPGERTDMRGDLVAGIPEWNDWLDQVGRGTPLFSRKRRRERTYGELDCKKGSCES